MMKNKMQVMKLLMQFANQNEDIRVFTMNGSRVNAKIPEDSFKDYDVVFFTDSISKYKNNKSFLKQFGEIMLVTEPENGLFSPTFLSEEGYIYLVQFMDGNRIDFQFRVLNHLEDYLREDSLTEVLVDKDNRIKKVIVPNDSNYWLKKPTQKLFKASIEEFWWQYLNTLKALNRDELTLAFFYLSLSRDELIRLLAWKIGTIHGFKRNYGKYHHKIISLLSKEEKRDLMNTYCGLSVAEMMHVLRNMAYAVQKLIRELSVIMGYSYHDWSQVPSLYLKAHNKIEWLDCGEDIEN